MRRVTMRRLIACLMLVPLAACGQESSAPTPKVRTMVPALFSEPGLEGLLLRFDLRQPFGDRASRHVSLPPGCISLLLAEPFLTAKLLAGALRYRADPIGISAYVYAAYQSPEWSRPREGSEATSRRS